MDHKKMGGDVKRLIGKGQIVMFIEFQAEVLGFEHVVSGKPLTSF